MAGRPIVFLSDYGLDDEFVGICHGVMARISPDSRIIDLSHAVPAHDILRGALLLIQSIRFMPADAVYLVVVDPGVGTNRRPVAISATDGPALVGPDNGVLSLAWAALEGTLRAAEITSPRVLLNPVAPTFHGRDVFGPAAAHLASGMPLDGLGPSVELSSLARVGLPDPEIEDGRIRATVLGIDRFGNVQLALRTDHLAGAQLDGLGELQVRTSSRIAAVRRVQTFAEVPEGHYGALVDSRGWLAVVRRNESAAKALGLHRGDPVFVEAPSPFG
jgi:S-adenosylmethionine hydrolase